MSAQDPRNKFKTDNYEKQEQEVPGIQAKMSPQPDCGEDSYHGHHRLDGFKILVTGGDSAIGRAAAIAYAKEGADVAINYLPSEQQDADDVKQIIENVGQKAILIPGDIRDEQFNYDMVEKAYQQLGGLDNVTLVAGHQLYQDELSEFKTKRLKRMSIRYFGQSKKRLSIYNQEARLQQHLQFKVIILVQFFMIMLQRKLQLYL